MSKPILFSTPMVQAILEDRKTQTRRVITRLYRLLAHGGPILGGRVVGESGNSNNPLGFMTGCGIERPAYQPGDILWVRETWRVRNVYGDLSHHDRTAEIEYKAGGNLVYIPVTEDAVNQNHWRPSIHMPRAAARIFLRVADVRVERVQDISEEDAIAEGIPECSGHKAGDDCCCASLAYSALWDELNTKRGYGWETNPWVWLLRGWDSPH